MKPSLKTRLPKSITVHMCIETAIDRFAATHNHAVSLIGKLNGKTLIESNPMTGKGMLELRRLTTRGCNGPNPVLKLVFKTTPSITLMLIGMGKLEPVYCDFFKEMSKYGEITVSQQDQSDPVQQAS